VTRESELNPSEPKRSGCEEKFMSDAMRKTAIVFAILFPFIGRCWADAPLVEPNDVLSVIVYDEAQLTRDYTVSPDGYIAVPFAGQLKVEGLTLAQVQEQLQKALSRHFRQPVVAVSFRERFRRDFIYVLGEVKNPGPYTFSAGYSLRDYIGRAGGVTLEASPDEVFIISGQTQQKVALFAEGDSSLTLKPGDTILVPLRPQQIYVVGEVNRPGAFRFVAGFGVADYLGQAGGLTRDGSPDSIVVLSGTKRFNVSLGQTASAQPVLKAGDTIFVPLAPQHVYVLGEVRNPGPVQFVSGMTILEAINQCGGPAPDADTSSVVLYRRAGSPEGIVVDYRGLLRNPSSANNLQLNSGDTVVVGRAPMVYISGEVAHPGAFTPLPGYTLSDYLGLAGGFLVSANMRNVILTHADGRTEVLDMHPDGQSAVNGKRSLFPGDSVYVPPRIERVYVGGEVAHPGEFDVREGFRLSDYVGLAGGMTERADGKHALLFRRSEGKVEARTFDLGKVLSGKSEELNLELKNGDTVFVPQKLWANRIEDYGILGNLLATIALWFRVTR
jgi:protein involved in polysaccharide export with SLBB domain